MTELRFTQARAEYTIENASLVFSDVSVIGANSAIEAKGTYYDRQAAARLLGEDIPRSRRAGRSSRSSTRISAPISAVFRVKLAGSIDKPSWSFAYSPLTLLRAGDVKAGAPERPAPPSPLANPPP